jgi:hypothetical protein
MTPLQVLIESIRGRLSMQESSQPDGSSATELRHDHQYFTAGLIVEMDILADPERLRRLDLSGLEA